MPDKIKSLEIEAVREATTLTSVKQKISEL